MGPIEYRPVSSFTKLADSRKSSILLIFEGARPRRLDRADDQSASIAMHPRVSSAQLGTIKAKIGKKFSVLAIRNGLAARGSKEPNGSSSVGTIVGILYNVDGILWPLVESADIQGR